MYLSFDDGPSGVFTHAYPYMAARGIKGTSYTVTDLIGTAGYMTVANLQTLDGAGWAIANHSKSHPNLTTLNLAQQEAELTGAKNALDGWGLTGASRHVAYPGGNYNATTLTAMANAAMLTGRTAYDGEFGAPPSVPYELPTRLYYKGYNLGALTAAIGNAVSGGLHLIVLMHNVVESGGASYDITYAEFTALVDWLYANEIPCKTIAELPLA